MALKVGDKAPNFKLASTSGEDFVLDETLQGKPCILYFYPKDFTRGCTAEACDFRDNITFFNQFEVDVLGISRDTIATHQSFRSQYELPFHLLSDKNGKVSAKYNALIPIIGINKRITYLLDTEHTIVAIYDNFFGAKEHIQNMIAKVKNLENN
ncbi:MAG: peroxiredoxin [Cytophagales bacterium]|nr:MAG: peroxiredoxin [Cytophagales bacterium]